MPKPKTPARAKTPHRPYVPSYVPTPQYKTDPWFPPCWPANSIMEADALSYLQELEPDTRSAIHVLIFAALERAWWRTARSGDGIQKLMKLTSRDE